MAKRKSLIFSLLGITVLSLAAFISLPKAYFQPKPACTHAVSENLLHATNTFTPEYQKEVRSILETNKPGDFRYFFKTFLQQGETNYILVNLRNDQYCFDALMMVDRWDKLGGMKRTNGVSYPEEIYELKWKIAEKNGKQLIVYQDMHPIID
jgi:hypothetical protein